MQCEGVFIRNPGNPGKSAGSALRLTAEVLAENIAMLRVFEKSGLRLNAQRESGVVHVVLRLRDG
jgi:RimJ/RimL family protein N-acetyltransferase